MLGVLSISCGIYLTVNSTFPTRIDHTPRVHARTTSCWAMVEDIPQEGTTEFVSPYYWRVK